MKLKLSLRTYGQLRPTMAALTQMTTLFNGRAALPDTHSGQVYLVRRDAQLVWRTADLPAPRHVVDLLIRLSANA